MLALFGLSVFLTELNLTELYLLPACGRPLVGPVESPLIKDSSITASSKQTSSAKMSEARIGGNDGWSPHASDKLPYLQFDLEKLYLICGFELLGCKGSSVSLYRVHVSPEKEYLDSWNIIKVMTSECSLLTNKMKRYATLLINI